MVVWAFILNSRNCLTEMPIATKFLICSLIYKTENVMFSKVQILLLLCIKAELCLIYKHFVVDMNKLDKNFYMFEPSKGVRKIKSSWENIAFPQHLGWNSFQVDIDSTNIFSAILAYWFRLCQRFSWSIWWCLDDQTVVLWQDDTFTGDSRTGKCIPATVSDYTRKPTC